MNSTSNPAISVIVPVFNVEKYIDKCINSILEQEFTDFELIIVDDGSTDSSGEICDKYAEIDNRIKVIHKKNEGVSIARNIGIELSQGEWIYFVDSDDWIDFDLLSTFKKNISDDIGLYFIGLKVETIDSNILEYTFDECLFTDKKDAIKYIYNKRIFGVTCNKLFNNKIIKDYNIRFNIQLNSYEDELFTLEYCRYINCIKTINFSGYHYRYVSSGLSKRILLPKERFCIALLLYKSMINISRDNDFINYAKKYLTYHLYDSFEQYYKRSPITKISNVQKNKYLLICYDLLHKNDFCKGLISNKRIIVLKIIFLVKNSFIIDVIFRFDILRLRIKLGKEYERK